MRQRYSLTGEEAKEEWGVGVGVGEEVNFFFLQTYLFATVTAVDLEALLSFANTTGFGGFGSASKRCHGVIVNMHLGCVALWPTALGSRRSGCD